MSAEADGAMCFVTVAHATSHGDPGPQRHTAQGGTGALEKLEVERGWQNKQGKITGNLSCSFGPKVLEGTARQSLLWFGRQLLLTSISGCQSLSICH